MANIQMGHGSKRGVWNLWLGLCVGFVLLSGHHAWAQLDQGTITGVVQDKTGAVIPDARVTLTSTDTGLVLQTKSDGSGIYNFSPIKIGNFTVSASSPGFQTTVQLHVHLDVQQRLNVVLVLAPGAVSQTVTVSTAPTLLQTQQGSVGQVVSTRTINNTPLNGRNWVYIAQLTAGVAPAVGAAHAILIRDPFAPGGTPDPSNPHITCAAHTRNLHNWYNPCAFRNPPPGANIPRTGPGSLVTSYAQALQYLGPPNNQITGPGYEQVSMSLFKNFSTFRAQYLQFRVDIFNLLNTPDYGDPSVTNDNTNGGEIIGARFLQNLTPDARFLQLSLKYVF